MNLATRVGGFVVLFAILAAVGLWSFDRAYGQPGRPGGAGQAGAGGRGGDGGRGGAGGAAGAVGRVIGGLGGAGGMGGALNMVSPTAIAASGEYVFVVRGDKVYKLSASDLAIVKQVDLPPVVVKPAAE